MDNRKRRASDSTESVDTGLKKIKALVSTPAAYGCRQGEREDMQDTHIMHSIFDLGDGINFLSRCSFFAIFDGHAGPRASEFCQKHMARTIKEKLSKFSDLASMTKGLKNVFFESYKSIDDSFLSMAKESKPVWKDGTTASTMLILNNTIYVANIGDSKVIVARKNESGSLTPFGLTVDHNPMAHEERMRIQKAGAVVKDGRINGIIEVSRSIGDAPFKSLGVINTPSIKKLSLSSNDAFAIIACDGLWKSFSNLEAVQFAAEQLEAVKKMDLDPQPNESRSECELRCVAEKLAAEAVRRKCGDNVSVIIVKLDVIDNL